MIFSPLRARFSFGLIFDFMTYCSKKDILYVLFKLLYYLYDLLPNISFFVFINHIIFFISLKENNFYLLFFFARPAGLYCIMSSIISLINELSRVFKNYFYQYFYKTKKNKCNFIFTLIIKNLYIVSLFPFLDFFSLK